MWLWCYTCKIFHLWSNAGAECSAKPSEDNTADDAVPSKYPRPWRLAALLLLAVACNGTPPPPPPTTTTTVEPPQECTAVERQSTRAFSNVERQERGGQRIVGGTEAAPGAWPWAAAMTFRTSSGFFQYCGGALIDPYWVLSAAHCEVEVGDTVILGRHDLRTSAGEEIRVDRVLTHRDYAAATNDDDISLAHLERASGQATIALGPEAPLPGEPVTVIGWGLTSEGGSASDVLRQVSVAVVSQEECSEAYALTENMICAGLPLGGRDSCQGDSGGPLMARIGAGWAHVGIVSFGEGCGRPNAPGVYTRISNYLGWVTACTP